MSRRPEPASGLFAAPISRAVAMTVGLLSVFFGSSRGSGITYHNLAHGKIWVLFTSGLIFETMPELLIGLTLLYQFGKFERQMGFRKFGAFVCILFVLNMILQAVLVLSFGNSPAVKYTPRPGPLFLIFALLKYFYAHVPKIRGQSVGVLGLQFSFSFQKVWVYALALQLMFSAGFSYPSMLNTVIPALSGLLFGVIYDMRSLKLNRILLPQRAETVFDSLSAYLPQNYVAMQAQRQGYGQEQEWAAPAGRAAAAAAAAPRYEEPSEDAIAALMGMGFDRADVLRALRNSNNNVNVAAEFLLSNY